MDTREHSGALEALGDAEGFAELTECVTRATELLERRRLRDPNPRREPFVPR